MQINKAGAILIQKLNGKILILHQKASDFWGFPKGTKENSETWKIAAIRELKEETGKSYPTNLFNSCISLFTTRLYVIIGEHDYKCNIDGEEIDDYKWVTFKELTKLKLSKTTKRFLPTIKAFV